MASSYSSDIRDRVVAFVGAGHSRRAAARRFAVSESFSIKLVRRAAETGSSAPGRQGRPRGSGKLEPQAGFLIGLVEAQPDITMPELSARPSRSPWDRRRAGDALALPLSEGVLI